MHLPRICSSNFLGSGCIKSRREGIGFTMHFVFFFLWVYVRML